MIDECIRIALIGGKVGERRGSFVVQWLDPLSGEWADFHCPNRLELARFIAIVVARIVRGEKPDPNEVMDLDTLTSKRRSGDA